jgi:hypothetical protein
VEYDPANPDAAVNALTLIQEAAKIGREVTGMLLVDESQPTMADNANVSAERAPALLDISLDANLQSYKDLLATLR